MAENKKSIVVYADWIKKFEALTDDEAGKLIKHFFRYVNDQNPVAPDRITELSFIDIEQSLKRDLIKWEKRAERSRENGRKGGRPEEKQNPEKPKETQQVILEPKKPDSDNVSVNDSVIVNDILLKKETKINNIEERKLKFASTLEEFIPKYGRELIIDFYKYWTETNKSNTKFKQEGEKTWSLERRLETWAKNELKFSKPINKKNDQIVAGRQTMETIKKNLDASNLYVPGLEN